MKQQNSIPPKSAERFLSWFCKDELIEEILGDLQEYYDGLEEKSQWKRKLLYWFHVFNFLRPFALKKIIHNKSTWPIMYKHHFKIGLRHLVINKGYSFINITGLAIGMSVAMLIGLWVWDELSYNKNHENYHRIAQVMRSGTLNATTYTYPYLPYALGAELRDVYGASFKHVVTSSLPGEHILTYKENKLSQHGSFIDRWAPEMFTFDMLQGTNKGLDELHSIFLSASAATRLFGDEDPIGKLLVIDNSQNVQVTGVYADFPRNCKFHGMDFFAPWELYVSENPWIRDQGFGNNFLNIFVELKPGTDFDEASYRIKDAILDNVTDRPDYVKINPQLQLHPMSRWHLYSEWENGVSTGGLVKFVWLFSITGMFVLLLACINFMNLSTARSEKRSREVGVRKALGSRRGQLVSQFFTESYLMVVIAFALSLILIMAALTWFNELSGKQLVLPWNNLYFWMMSLSFLLITGFLSGSYPALYLSSFNPLKVLKGTFRIGGNAAFSRKALVVVQFTVSVTLIIGTIIIFNQIQFAKDRPVGYSRDNLLMIQMTSPDFDAKYDVLEAGLKNSGVVEEMARSLSPVTGVWSSNGGFKWRGIDPDWQQEDFATLPVTPNYGKTVDWQFISGRDFKMNLASDSLGFIINETAAEVMGFDDPVGEIIEWSYTNKKYTVIGVVRDMIMDSPFSTPMPTIFFLDKNLAWINIKINPKISVQEALSRIETVFNRIIPSVPFSYVFADQDYASKFIAEERIGKLSGMFTLLAIFISCLGLFGMASFVAEQRTKEIGIRKVLGASMGSIWTMLSKEFVVLVTISCLLAFPIAYYFLNSWLQNYEYRVQISLWVIVVASVSSVIIALITVSYQIIKVAIINPVNSLKSE